MDLYFVDTMVEKREMFFLRSDSGFNLLRSELLCFLQVLSIDFLVALCVALILTAGIDVL